MKCPICKVEMEKGGLINNGNLWFNEGFQVSANRMSFKGGEVTYAYRCPECGKVELTTGKKSN